MDIRIDRHQTDREREGWTDGLDRQTYIQMDDRWMNRRMDGWTDREFI